MVAAAGDNGGGKNYGDSALVLLGIAVEVTSDMKSLR